MPRSTLGLVAMMLVAMGFVLCRQDAAGAAGFQLSAPNLMLVAGTCAAGSIWHPHLHRCVSTPACGPGEIWHPRLHRCVAMQDRSPSNVA